MDRATGAAQGPSMDHLEFREAAARVAAHREKYPHGDGEYCAECRRNCLTIATHAPALLAEIERLKKATAVAEAKIEQLEKEARYAVREREIDTYGEDL